MSTGFDDPPGDSAASGSAARHSISTAYLLDALAAKEPLDADGHGKLVSCLG